MRVKKLLKVTAIVALVLVTIGLLFVVAFIFNPFEGKVNDLRDVVPRAVDFFLRKEDLKADFVRFPTAKFWPEFEQSTAWDKIRRGPTYRGLDQALQLDKTLAQVREAVDQVARDTPLDLMRDVLGQEIEVAGSLTTPVEASTWCLYARVGWRVKVAFGVAGYGFVRNQFQAQGVVLETDGDLLKVSLRGNPRPLYTARHLDCVMLGNDRALVENSLRLARGESNADTLGGSSDYRDGVDGRLRAFEEAAKIPGRANALEVYLRPEQVFAVTGWDRGWPNPNHPDSMNQRVLAAFVSLAGWRFASGAFVFEPDSLAVLARVMLNQNEHTPFQAEFFRTEAQRRQEWLDPFLTMVPDDTCALAAMRMPAGPFLRQMYRALDNDLRTLFEDVIKRTGVYKSVDDLLGQLELAFLPRTGFVFRKNKPVPQIVVNEPTPLPQIAWVFWLRTPGGAGIVSRLYDTILKHHRTIFAGGTAYELNIEGRADKILECTNPNIPATGSMAFLHFDQFFIVSNSGPLIRDMIAARDGRVGSVLSRREMRTSLEELAPSINGFVYLQGVELERLLTEMDEYVQQDAGEVDLGFKSQYFSQAQSQVFRSKYARYGSQAGLPAEVKAQFEADVQEQLKAMWAERRGSYTADERAVLAESIGWCRTFAAAYLQVVLDPQSIQLQGRAVLGVR
ncbi:MAG: hypothetical protein R3F56_12535 [Planctomycetota bacterium]